jgi:hypothetical protein
MTGKELIFDAIKTKFANTGISNMILSFDVIDNSYNIMVKNTTDENLKIDIDKKEVSIIKLLFINKVKRKFEKDYKETLKSIFIQIDLTKESFELFTENEKGKVYKFDY